MRKCYVLLAALLCSYSMNAQVGINTTTPRASLDVVGNPTDTSVADGIIPPRITGDALKLKENSYGPNQNGAIVYVTTPVSDMTGAVKTANVVRKGFYIYDATFANSGNVAGTFSEVDMVTPGGTPGGGSTTGSGAYAAKFNGNITLLNLGIGLFNNNFLSLPLSTTTSVITNEIGAAQVTNNEYVVPSAGLYQINYSYRTGSGVSAELLSGGTPGVAILKTDAVGTQTLMDYRQFGGINLLDITVAVIPVVVSITLTQGQISHIYQLQAGDKLRFGIIQGGVNLGLLANRSAEISVYKIK